MLSQAKITELRQAKEFARAPYAWPGGYPKFLLTLDGECLCANCTRAEFKLICEETRDESNCGFRFAAIDINYENPDLYCAHCNKQIESAYCLEGEE